MLANLRYVAAKIGTGGSADIPVLGFVCVLGLC